MSSFDVDADASRDSISTFSLHITVPSTTMRHVPTAPFVDRGDESALVEDEDDNEDIEDDESVELSALISSSRRDVERELEAMRRSIRGMSVNKDELMQTIRRGNVAKFLSERPTERTTERSTESPPGSSISGQLKVDDDTYARRATSEAVSGSASTASTFARTNATSASFVNPSAYAGSSSASQPPELSSSSKTSSSPSMKDFLTIHSMSSSASDLQRSELDKLRENNTGSLAYSRASTSHSTARGTSISPSFSTTTGGSRQQLQQSHDYSSTNNRLSYQTLSPESGSSTEGSLSQYSISNYQQTPSTFAAASQARPINSYEGASTHRQGADLSRDSLSRASTDSLAAGESTPRDITNRSLSNDSLEGFSADNSFI